MSRPLLLVLGYVLIALGAGMVIAWALSALTSALIGLAFLAGAAA